MMINLKKLIATLVAITLASAVMAKAAPYDDGVSAYEAKNYSNALSILKPLAEQGNDDAQYYMGIMYFYGHGVTESNEQAHYWFLKSAEAGDLDAQFRMGRLYDNGWGVEKSFEQSFIWYLKAAKQGQPAAMAEVGIAYREGQGTSKSFKQAVTWFKKAIENDHVKSMNHLGVMYEKGQGVKQSYFEAAKLYAAAGDKGNANGRAYLAELYEVGNGVAKDQKRAIEMYKQAAVQGSDYAKKRLKALNESNEMEGDKAYAAYLKGDYKKAVALWKLQMIMSTSTVQQEQNRVNVQYNLGNAYEKGEGVSKDYKTAFGYYRGAAMNDHAEAQNRLANLYYYGRGVTESKMNAAIWYERSAKLGDPEGQYQFGIMFDEGIAVPKDKDMAMFLYSESAAQGHAMAKRALRHYAFMEEKKLRDAQFERLKELAAQFAAQRSRDQNKARRERRRCNPPLGNSSYIRQQMLKRGYLYKFNKPSGC